MNNLVTVLIILAIISVTYYNPLAKDTITDFFSNIISPSTTSIADIVKSPDSHTNRTLTIRGTLAMSIFDDMFLRDDQGYEIKLDCKQDGRRFELSGEKQTYKAKGIIYFKNEQNLMNWKNTTFFKCIEPMIKIS